jgi:hypothetical protein
MADDGNKEDNKDSRSVSVLGSEELKGFYYVYGELDQVEKYIKTTKKIGDFVAQKFTKEIGILVDKGTEATFEEPKAPDKDATKAVEKRYEMQLKICMEREEKYRQDKSKVFRIIIGQCKPAMRNKIECLPDYESLEKNDDVAGLLKKMKGLVYTTDNVQYEFWTMQSVLRSLVTMHQEKQESLQAFAKRFLSQLESTEEVWGELIPRKFKGQASELQEKGKHKFLACLFLAGVDRERYKKVIDDLNNDFIVGKISYPEDVPGMLNLLTHRRGAGGNKRVDAIRDGVTGASFAQSSGKGKGKKAFVCYICGEEGHKAYWCPTKKNKKSNRDDDSVGSDNNPKNWKGTRRVGWNGFQDFHEAEKRAWNYNPDN